MQNISDFKKKVLTSEKHYDILSLYKRKEVPKLEKDLIWEMIEGIQNRHDIIATKDMIMDEWELSPEERQQMLSAVQDKLREVR